jgi:hypothetical protein
MRMKDRSVRAIGLVLSIVYAIFIMWLYVRQPQTVAEVTGGLAASVGAYRIDQQAFADGLEMFRRDQFEAARAAFERADPAEQDAPTQFYIAYSYYRSGWGRLYQDDELFGLERLDKAIALAPAVALLPMIPDLPSATPTSCGPSRPDSRTDASDFNPMRVFRKRK